MTDANEPKPQRNDTDRGPETRIGSPLWLEAAIAGGPTAKRGPDAVAER